MLKMAQKLTSDHEWNLYWTDLVYNNFAVDNAGKLMYIDTENIIVVDKEATEAGTTFSLVLHETPLARTLGQVVLPSPDMTVYIVYPSIYD